MSEWECVCVHRTVLFAGKNDRDSFFNHNAWCLGFEMVDMEWSIMSRRAPYPLTHTRRSQIDMDTLSYVVRFNAIVSTKCRQLKSLQIPLFGGRRKDCLFMRAKRWGSTKDRYATHPYQTCKLGFSPYSHTQVARKRLGRVDILIFHFRFFQIEMKN